MLMSTRRCIPRSLERSRREIPLLRLRLHVRSDLVTCVTNSFYLVIKLLENLLALDEDLESDFFGRISEYSIEAFHLLKLSLFVPVLAFFQFSNHPIQERDIMLH